MSNAIRTYYYLLLLILFYISFYRVILVSKTDHMILFSRVDMGGGSSVNCPSRDHPMGIAPERHEITAKFELKRVFSFSFEWCICTIRMIAFDVYFGSSFFH